MKKTIGILGGMGPEATAYFFKLIIQQTKASKDQEHISIIIFNYPEIPARTDAILKRGPSPLPFLLEGVRRLRKAGADFIVMPCITVHAFLPQIIAREKISFINLLDVTLTHVRKRMPGLKQAGLIASTGTLKSKIFQKTFGQAGIKIIHPAAAEQRLVMEAIFGKRGVKAGFTSGLPKETIIKVAQRLIRRGAEAVIAGCTEVPLVLKDNDISVPLIEPMLIASRACVLKAGYKTRSI